MSKRVELLLEVYTQWSTEDLIRVTTLQREDYTAEALALMDQVLRTRQLPTDMYEQTRVKVAAEEDRRAGPKWEQDAFRAAHPLKSFLASERMLLTSLFLSVSYLVLEVTLVKLKVISESPVWVALFWLSLCLLLLGASGTVIRYRNLYPRVPLSFAAYIFLLLAGIFLAPFFLAVDEISQSSSQSKSIIIAIVLFLHIIPAILAPFALAGILSLRRGGWMIAMVHRAYAFTCNLIVLIGTFLSVLVAPTPGPTFPFLLIQLCVNGYWLGLLWVQRPLFR